MRNIINYFSILIFLFFSLCLPLYYYSANKEIAIIRNIFYFSCCFGTLIILVASFRKLKLNHLAFSLIILFSWCFFYLSISYYHYNLETSQSDMIAITYSLFALVLGIKLQELAQKKYFLFLMLLVWLVICLIVYTSIDFTYFQAFYGKFDEEFSGTYQYIGDTYALVSILFIFRLATLVNTQENFPNFDPHNHIIKYEPIIFICINVITITSIIFLFFNSSRASFYSFLVVSFYIYYCSYSRIKANRLYTFILILIASVIFLLVLNNTSFLSNIDLSFLASNRILEFLKTNDSTSLSGRNDLYTIGIQDILYNPIFGNYINRVLERGEGSYIHNILGILQDFGIPAFISFLYLIMYCMRYFMHSWKFTNDYRTMLLNSIFIFSIVQLIFFRYPLGFYVIFVAFGLALKLKPLPQNS